MGFLPGASQGSTFTPADGRVEADAVLRPPLYYENSKAKVIIMNLFSLESIMATDDIQMSASSHKAVEQGSPRQQNPPLLMEWLQIYI